MKTFSLLIPVFFACNCIAQNNVKSNILQSDIVNKTEIDKMSLPRTEYYSTGQNGIELIGKIGDKKIVVSTYDSNPKLKEIVAQTLFESFVANNLTENSIMPIVTTDATVTGKCTIDQNNKLVNIIFYFQKIEWNSGLTQIHKGKEFVAKASSPTFAKRKNAFRKKSKNYKKKIA